MSSINRKKVYEITNGKCFYCGCKLDFDNFHADHLEAKSKGGKQHKNLVPSCPECNMCKSDMTIEEFREKLENILVSSFTGRIIKKYYKPKKHNITFWFEEERNGNIQNGINDILDRR